MNNKQTLSEIKFALENGHTNVTMGTEKDGSFYIMGTFGYIASNDQDLVNEIKELVTKYTVEVVAEKLTTKEMKVLKSLVENTYEIGLPVEVDEIQADTKMSKRSIVGVISSLYKKGIVESYDLDNLDEFMLTEKAFETYA